MVTDTDNQTGIDKRRRNRDGAEQEALRGATAEVIDVPIEMLGISVEHLVRPIVEEDAYGLAEKDESKWEPIEIRLWPAGWEKPTPAVIYHVVSGNHRTRAAQIKSLPTVRARLIDAPDERSYLVTAIKSNTQHGKNFTREEYETLAKKLQEQGLPLAEIASILGYSKSAVSRLITGNDSHASRKQQEPVLTMPYAPLPRDMGDNQLQKKMMGLLMDAQFDAGVVPARDYVRTLTPAHREALRNLAVWLQEVMEG